MRNIFKIIAVLIVFSFINTPFVFAQKAEPENIEELIKWLGNQIYAAAETNGGSPEKWTEFQSEALDKYEIIITNKPEALLSRNRHNQTPLQLASIRGYYFFSNKNA